MNYFFFILFAALSNSVFSQPVTEGKIKNLKSSPGNSVQPKQYPGACGTQGGVIKNGSGSLGAVYSNTACGLNFVYTSRMITTRYDGYTTTGTYGCGLPCTYAISGLPACISVEKAFVWFILSYVEGSAPSASVSITNPQGSTSTIAATLSGTGGNKCWGETGTAVYRADVTAAITGNGNYIINFSGITNPTWGLDGAELMIFYRDPLATYQGSIVIYDGNVTGVGTAYSQNIGGFNACANSTAATAFLIVSDMQDNVNGGFHPGTLNGVTASYANAFWCLDQTATNVTAGQTTASYGVDGLGSDCWTFGVAGLYWQTTSCVTCTPTPPSTLTINTSTTNATCGQNNGQAQVTSVSGGSSPYTYSWNTSPVQTASNATGLAPGSYNVIIKDATGCTQDTATVNIATGSGMSVTASNTNVTCYGTATGTATAATSGGVAPFTFQWSNGQTLSTATALVAGTYTVTVKDTSSACSLITSVTVTQPVALTTSILQSSNATCSGVNDGSATADASGGTQPYSFQWDAGAGNQNNATATGLTAGTYSVTITDSKACTSTASAVITMPGAVSATASYTNGTCYGANNGTASVSASGGTPPLGYLWSGGQTTTSVSGLSPGSYTVTVTSNDCSPSGTELVSNGNFSSGNTGFSSGYSYCNSSGCLGPEGTYAIGTNPNYFHGAFYGNDHTTGSGNLMIINGSGTPNASVWCQTITVTPNTNYVFSTWVSTMVVGSPAQLQFSINGVNLGNIFSAPNSQYVWVQFFTTWFSGASTTASICIVNQNTTLGGNDFALDDISFQVCNANCKDVETVTISEPSALIPSPSVADASCSGYSDGSSSVAISGGTAAYTYQWDAAAANQTTSTATGLSAGSYTITVMDANNCNVITSVTVSEPTLLASVIGSSTDVSCFGGNNGSATVNASGSSPPYTYQWDDMNLQTVSTATGLAAGNYNVAVVDDHNCYSVSTVTITEPALLVSSIIQSSNVSCFGGMDGKAKVGASGGIIPYSYLWNSSPVQSADSAINLQANSYTVTVTDGNGCTRTSSVTITQPPLLTAAISNSTNVTCNGYNDGTATVNAGGGVTAYTYSWNDPKSQTTAIADSLPPGSYVIQVADANNCLAFASVTITQPLALLSVISGSTDVSCFGFNDGDASVSAFGGTPSYIYIWNDPANQVSQTATGLYAGTYSVTVIDANNCSDSSAVTITEPPLLVTAITSISNITCNGYSDGQLSTVTSGGTPIYTFSWDDPQAQGGSTAINLPPGQYIVTVKDANNCTTTDTAVITEPPLLVVTVSPDTTICTGGAATISVSGSGGTPPLTYVWDHSLPPTTTQTVSPVTNDVYTVIVIDSNLCTANAKFIAVNVNPVISAWIPPPAEICYGDSSTFTAIASGGDGNFSYTWNQGIGLAGNTVTVSPLTTTTYSVTVDDGCETPPVTATADVIVNPLPVIGFTDTARGCAPLAAVFSDTSKVAGGTIVQWAWSFSDNDNGSSDTTLSTVTHVFNVAGTYSVSLIVISAKGCRQSAVKPGYVTVYPLPNADFYAYPSPTTVLAPKITFTDLSSVSSGYIDDWLWDFDDENTDTKRNTFHTYRDTGHYNVCLITTTDHGCIDTNCRLITVLGEFSLLAPSAFTPNNDGINEIFLPKHIGVNEANYYFVIYDRWGDIIFQTKEPYKGWDGIANDGKNLAQQDVYVWVVNTTDINGAKHRFIGHVTLVK